MMVEAKKTKKLRRVEAIREVAESMFDRAFASVPEIAPRLACQGVLEEKTPARHVRVRWSDFVASGKAHRVILRAPVHFHRIYVESGGEFLAIATLLDGLMTSDREPMLR